jgi:hypothetical protein
MRAALHNLRSFEACDCHMYPESISPDLNTNAHTPHLPYPIIGSWIKRQLVVSWRRSPPFQASQFGATLLQGILHFHISWINHVGTPFQTRQHMFTHPLWGSSTWPYVSGQHGGHEVSTHERQGLRSWSEYSHRTWDMDPYVWQ